ncbi:CPBP family intramembrane metalloprotease [Candidatus Sumerlaeota bacterium]|nr:CPBP family intramembrane metalloprotease [Candidatus Sumerlaeota bacterium]
MARRYRLLYFCETILVYAISIGVVYYATSLFNYLPGGSLLNRPFNACFLRVNLRFTSLLAFVMGCVLLPLLWERVFRKRNLRDFGVRIPEKFLTNALLSILLFLLLFVYVHIVLATPRARPPFTPLCFFLICVGWLVSAFCEEFLFRGFIQRRFSHCLGTYSGWVVASIFFAFLFHPLAPILDNLLFRFPFALIVGFVYLRTQSILIPTVMHWAMNMLFAG